MSFSRHTTLGKLLQAIRSKPADWRPFGPLLYYKRPLCAIVRCFDSGCGTNYMCAFFRCNLVNKIFSSTFKSVNMSSVFSGEYFSDLAIFFYRCPYNYPSKKRSRCRGGCCLLWRYFYIHRAIYEFLFMPIFHTWPAFLIYGSLNTIAEAIVMIFEPLET